MPLDAISIIPVFIFGSLIGSFLNVVICRLPHGNSIVYPPSSCMSCNTRIAWYHNVPIFSYLILRGRCASCGTSFSLRYPVVELITATVAVACVAVFGLSFIAARIFLLICLLIALTYIDLEHWLLPHAITMPGIVLGLGTSWLPGGNGIIDALIGAGAGFLGFWLLRIVASAAFKREALGGGDIWLLAMIGSFMGWQALVPIVFLASVQGSAIGLLLLMARSSDGRDPSEASAEDFPDSESDLNGDADRAFDAELENVRSDEIVGVPFDLATERTNETAGLSEEIETGIRGDVLCDRKSLGRIAGESARQTELESIEKSSMEGAGDNANVSKRGSMGEKEGGAGLCDRESMEKIARVSEVDAVGQTGPEKIKEIQEEIQEDSPERVKDASLESISMETNMDGIEINPEGSPQETPADYCPEDTDENTEDEWIPPENAVPFGPFLALASLQMIFLGDAIMNIISRFIGF